MTTADAQAEVVRDPGDRGDLGEPGTTPARRRRPDLWDLGAAVLILSVFVHWFGYMDSLWFVLDDWPLALRGDEPADLFEAYNGHLSVTYIGVYRAIYGIWGFTTYTPVAFVGAAALVSVPATLYWTARKVVAPWVAILCAIPFLLFPEGLVVPSAMNHWGAAAATVLLASVLRRDGGGADALVALWLGLALVTAGGGVAAAVGALTYVVLRPSTWRRRTAVVVPTAIWGLWYLTADRGESDTAELGTVAPRVVEGLYNTFVQLGFGTTVGGIALIVAFVGLVGARLRRGVRAAAGTIAWTTSAIFWWAATMYSREEALGGPDTPRYQFVAGVLLVLAALPEAAVSNGERKLGAPRSARAMGGAVLVLLLVVAAFAAVGGDSWGDQRRLWHRAGQNTEAAALMASLGRRVVPDDAASSSFGWMPARDVRRALDRYGFAAADPETIDRQVAESEAIDPIRAGPVDDACEVADGPVEVPAGGTARVWAVDGDVMVATRRFSPTVTPLTSVDAGRGVQILLPGFGADEPWVVEAEGACVLVAP